MNVKPPATYAKQIEKLRSRGCIIHDEAAATTILENVNYYRLTAYFLPFRQSNDKYAEGTNFSTVYNIYEFDRKARQILFSAIEETGGVLIVFAAFTRPRNPWSFTRGY